MADIERLIGFMAIMQVPFMNDPDALAYIEEVKTVLKQEKAQEPGWISVKDRLPENLTSVLALRKDGGIYLLEYFDTSPTDECWIDDYSNCYTFDEITHWMPLPEPPKEG